MTIFDGEPYEKSDYFPNMNYLNLCYNSTKHMQVSIVDGG
jgi:hypothetical protein